MQNDLDEVAISRSRNYLIVRFLCFGNVSFCGAVSSRQTGFGVCGSAWLKQPSVAKERCDGVCSIEKKSKLKMISFCVFI